MYELMQLLMSGFLGNVLNQWLRSGSKHFVVCWSSCGLNVFISFLHLYFTVVKKA